MSIRPARGFIDAKAAEDRPTQKQGRQAVGSESGSVTSDNDGEAAEAEAAAVASMLKGTPESEKEVLRMVYSSQINDRVTSIGRGPGQCHFYKYKIKWGGHPSEIMEAIGGIHEC